LGDFKGGKVSKENNKISFCFGIHNHQPVGNFGWVMEDSANKSYIPFLDVLNKFPSIRIAIHTSGPLLEWIETNMPEYIDKLGRLVENRQVEILGGGFYEPILTMLPKDDALFQLDKMKTWAKDRLGAKVRGIWLTERIWEPSLPLLLSEADVEFTICDTTHFQWAGLMPEDINGYYITEKLGSKLAVFPIDRNLRYTIPFHDPKETIDILSDFAQKNPGGAITYADDGEKFGVWPGTYNLCFEREWLDKFFTLLTENDDLISFTLFSEVLDSQPPKGRVILPTASYLEMTQWALPPKAGYNLEQLTKDIKSGPDWEKFEPFLRGGFWDNFLVKYTESNRIHKKMLRVSKKVSAIDPAKKELKEKGETALFRGQCNCAYWHGLFGGLYLNYLRDALYRNLLEAENIADQANFGIGRLNLDITDFDADGFDDVILENDFINAVIAPAKGAAITLLDLRKFNHSLTNVLTRRPEAYHEAVKNIVPPKEDDHVLSIHEMAVAKEEGLADHLIFDHWERLSFQDHFFDRKISLDCFSKTDYPGRNDFIDSPYSFSREKSEERVKLICTRKGLIFSSSGSNELEIKKSFTLTKDRASLEITYDFTAGADPVKTLWGTEQNFTLLTKDADDRLLNVNGAEYKLNKTLSLNPVRGYKLIDGWQKMEFSVSVDKEMELWTFPVETVNQSEGGYERTYQGTSFTLLKALEIKAKTTVSVNIILEVKEVK